MVEICPSILSADFSKLGEEIKEVEPLVKRLHVDVMDGHFVPNITIGPPVIESIRKITNLKLDTHIMISNPEKYLKAFSDAGSDSVAFHIEVAKDPALLIEELKSYGKEAAISLNPKTPLSEILPFVEKLDYVLVMTVDPGFGGQGFMMETVPKIAELRSFIDDHGLKARIQVDGGVNERTAKMVVNAGAEEVVAGSAVFGKQDRAAAINGILDSLEN